MRTFISSYSNDNSSFSELISPEDSEVQNKQVNFENDYFIISDCNLQKILLVKKKRKESLTNERFNEQYSKDSFTSKKENELK